MNKHINIPFGRAKVPVVFLDGSDGYQRRPMLGIHIRTGLPPGSIRDRDISWVNIRFTWVRSKARWWPT